MTSPLRVRDVVAPALSAGATAALLLGLLWVQRTRDAWPYIARDSAKPGTATAPAHGIAAMEPGPAADRVPIDVAPSTLQDLGIRLATVRRESLTQLVQAVATIVPDESRISHVHTRVAGWVEHLDVNTTGELVRAGQPLAHIFSQELLSSQTEYLAVRKATAASGLTSVVVASGRTRLSVLGMMPSEIDAIERSGEPRRLVTIAAPRSGVVVNRGITVGTAVDPSTTILTIADLSRVWVLAEVPEANIPAIRVGSTAQLDFAASGRAPFSARVEFMYPTLTERTRTLRVRLTAANPRGALRPGSYGTAAFESAGSPTITVPRDAIVDTGRQQHVFIAVGNRYEPRPVTLGVQLADRVEVRSGLVEGDRIVAAGVFLLDSESRLRATGGGGGHSHGTPPAPARPPQPAPPSPLTAPVPHAGHEE
jgi:membrane fusion protein, copper/silver efflux system